MFGSLFGGRSTPATKQHRSRPSSHSSKATPRPKKTDDGEGDSKAEQVVTKRPDVEELRRKRQTYYGLSAAQRRQLVANAGVASKSKGSRSTSTVGKSASKDGVRRRRKQTASSQSRSKAMPSAKSMSRMEDFVYGSIPQNGRHSEGDLDTAQREEARGTPDRSSKRHPGRHSPSKRRSLHTVVESEVTPDNSISQVAERRDERQAQKARKTHSRPSMKRSSTTSSKLPSVAEVQQEDPQPNATMSTRSSKRASTLRTPALPTRCHSTTSVPQPKLVDCLTCGSDDIPLAKSAELSCTHRMCHDCLKRLFELSVKDPAHMPPKCCTDEHIPLKHVDKIFDLKFKLLWNRKYQEYHTRNRVYCPMARCGEWIKPKHFLRTGDGRKYALCPRCKTKVCTLCNSKMHKSSDCPQDPEIAKIVEQAKEKGWQRCFSCNAMVELQAGCNHMTCRCTAEFCMCCGAKWKTCNCPWFNYTSLPNPHQLNDMRVPEPVRVIYRRALDVAAGGVPPPQAAPQAPPPEVTYQQQLDARRRQERDDAELARRLQLASFWEDDPRQAPARRRPPEGAGDGTWGIGNAAGHFMNEDFVQNAANVVMNAFGDANFGRRGERSSGRRRRVRQDEGRGEGERDAGLAPNFLGDESVLGVGPARRTR